MRTIRQSAPSSSKLAWVILSSAAAAVSLLPQTAHAQTTSTWIGTTGNYVDPANWTPSLPNVASDINGAINNAGTALLSTGDAGEAAILVLGLAQGDSGNVSMANGSLNLGELNVGGRSLLFDNLTTNPGGTGTFTQNGGVVNVNSVASPSGTPKQNLLIGFGGLATNNTAAGSYVMTAGNLNVGVNAATTGSSLIIGSGVGSSGSFNQSGGTVQLLGSTFAGVGTLQIANSGSSATYSLSNSASLSTANGINIGSGAASNGSFTQSGGAASTTNFNVGFSSGTGSYSLSGGSLATSGFLYVGNGPGAVGSLNQSGGAITTTGVITVGNNSASGNYSLTGGTVLDNNVMNVGGTNSTFSMSGTSSPSLTVKGSLYVGQLGTGSATLSSGSINIGTSTSQLFVIGNNNGDTGTFTQMAGTSVTLSGVLDIGNHSTSPNLYDMQGGILTVGAGSYIGGYTSQTSGTGTMSQSGAASVTFASNLSLGYGAAGTAATGTYNLSGGTLAFSNASAILAVGNVGTGTFNQTGGALTITGASAVLDLGRSSGHGAYNLSGTGFLNTTLLRTNTASGNSISFSGDSSSKIGTLTLGTAGIMTVSGGTHTFTGVISTGSSTLAISGGAITWPTVANGLTLNANGTLQTSVDLSIPSPVLISSPVAVQVDSNTLTFAGSITTSAGSARTLNKNGNGTLVINNPTQSWVTNSIINTNAGTLDLDVAPSNIIVNAKAGATNFRNTESVTTLNITSGATAAIPAAGGTRTLTTTNLTANGTLDVADNTYNLAQAGATPLNNIRTMLFNGYNSGAWNGTSGILSSYAQSHPGRGLSYRDTGSLITVTYARMGDLTMDGVIDADDYALLDRNFARGTFSTGTAAHWTDGDFNYDGVLSSADYSIIDKSFALQSGGLDPSFLASRESQFGDAYVQSLIASVPEPTSLLAACGFALPLLSRRRKSR